MANIVYKYKFVKWNNVVSVVLLSIFIFSLLVVGCLSFSDIPVGELSGQWMWLGRTGILFMVGSLLAKLFFSGKSLGMVFYSIIKWELILLGGIEAIWGICQIFGVSSSNHYLYSVTGTFYNPGPYSGYLAMVFPVCLNEYIYFKSVKDKNWIDNLCFYISMIVLLLILCVLPAGMSRSAWMAVIVAGGWILSIHYSWVNKCKRVWSLNKRRFYIIVFLAVICFCIIIVVFFFLKKNSACGRLFMWKISGIAILERPLTGWGFNSFARVYGMTQEKYFAQGMYADWEELVAGNPKYAFNEYIQVALEGGILFLVCVIILLIYCLYIGWIKRRVSICAGIISLAVFALSSYPMQLPVFVVTLIFMFAACVLENSWKSWIVFSLILGIFGVYLWRTNIYKESVKWEDARARYNVGAYYAARENYESLYPVLRKRALFLFEYGLCLHKLEEYKISNKILQEASLYSCDPAILNLIGKNYQQMEDYENAEKYFIRSVNLLPGRLYPYYLLAKLYLSPSFYKEEKAMKMIEIVLNKSPKVNSKAIDEMRTEIRSLLKRMQLSN